MKSNKLFRALRALGISLILAAPVTACAPAYAPMPGQMQTLEQSLLFGLTGFQSGDRLQASGPFFTGGEGYLTEIAPDRLQMQLNYRTPMGGMFLVNNGQIALDIAVQAEADSTYTIDLTDRNAGKSYRITGMQQSGSQLYKNADGQNLSFSFAQSAPGSLQLSSSLMMGHTLTLQRY